MADIRSHDTGAPSLVVFRTQGKVVVYPRLILLHRNSESYRIFRFSTLFFIVLVKIGGWLEIALRPFCETTWR